jgi:hypothetical protein
MNIETNARSLGWMHPQTGKHRCEVPAFHSAESPEHKTIGYGRAIRE